MPDDNDGQVDPFEGADKVTGDVRKRWWASLDSERRAAWSVLLGSGSVGALGVPLFTVLASAGKVPSSKSFVAGVWLLVITLPVAAVAGLICYLLVSPPKLQGGPQLLLAGVAAAILGVVVMDALIAKAGGSLAGFYCYNNGTVQEEACRSLNELGLANTPIGSPAQNASFLGHVFVLTADARGFVMAMCGLFAGGAAGYLIRRAEG